MPNAIQIAPHMHANACVYSEYVPSKTVNCLLEFWTAPNLVVDFVVVGVGLQWKNY